MKVYAPGEKSAIVIDVQTDDPVLARTAVIDFLKESGPKPQRVFAVINGSEDACYCDVRVRQDTVGESAVDT